MGVVDLARDQNGARVAIKRLTLHGSAGDMLRARQRLLREAEVLRRLQHPNIVRLLDVVEDGDEIVLVMPYLNGGNLAERVSQHGPAPVPEVERLTQRLLSALATAHAQGIIHRDIKPGNVLFDERGEPCLADFGVAHTWDQTGGLTVAGMVVGTPGFMAPEQARDEPLTPASDVFALGATLLYAATGSGPFGSGDPALLMVRAADGKVERIPKSLPPGLRRRLRAMLDPRPDRRPTAAALLTGDQSALSAPPGRLPLSKAGPLVAVAAFSGAAVLVALGVSADRSGDDLDAIDGPSTAGESPGTTAPGDAGSTAPGGSGTTDPDDAAGNPAGDGEEQEAALADEAQGVIEAGEDLDSYWLPMGQEGECPTEVHLEVTAPPDAGVGVRVVRSVLDQSQLDPVAEARTQDGEAALMFSPVGCPDPQLRYRVLITRLGDSTGTIPYRIIRDDS
jgi:hypothetical protein